MKRIFIIFSIVIFTGNEKDLRKILLNFEMCLASAMMTPAPVNNTEQMQEDIEEIKNLHHLLNGYNSILYRYDEKSNAGRVLDNFQSNAGRPDRVRSKYSTNEAIEKLHNVDEIFPIYQNYFNVSEANDSNSLRDLLSERVQNIQQTLYKLEKVYPEAYPANNSGKMTSLLTLVMIVMIFLELL